MLAMLGCLAIFISVQSSIGAFTPTSKEELATAVKLWSYNASSASHIFGDISQWDVSNVTDMSHVFGWSRFNADLSKWNVSKVTNMDHMFYSSYFNGDLSKWDVSKVTNMGYMFYANHKLNSDLSKWDVSRVTDMNSMFTRSHFKYGDLSKWDVSKVIDMRYMFEDSSFHGDLSKWDVSQVTFMNGMFSGDSCSLCDHVPQGLERACRSQCFHPSVCRKALSENQCSVLTQCTWCKSKDHLHKLCLSKAQTPLSGWVCDGEDVGADDLAHIMPLVLV